MTQAVSHLPLALESNFDPGPVHVRCLLENAACSPNAWCFPVSIIPPMLHSFFILIPPTLNDFDN
jgi:hypothetical protein